MSRDYTKDTIYESSPEQIHKRVLRNAARRAEIAAGDAHKGDGKDVDHKHMLKTSEHPSAADANRPANLRELTQKQNRGWRKGHHGY